MKNKRSPQRMLIFSLENLFFPIYYNIFVIVNYDKKIRLRRIGFGNSSNLMKYRDKLFSPMAGHAFMVCLARWITKEGRHSKPVIRSFIASYGAISFFIFYYSVDICRHFLFMNPAHTVFFLRLPLPLLNRDIREPLTSLSYSMIF